MFQDMDNLVKTIKYFRIGWFFLFILSCLVFLAYFLSLSSSLEIKTKKDLDFAFGNKFTQPFYAKGFYVTSWTASDERKVNQLIKLLKENNFNTLVIDIKDVSGQVAYLSRVPQVKERQTGEPKIKDIKRIVERLHLLDIYAIARIAVFQDATLPKIRPDLALRDKYTNQPWRDFKGLTWLNPSSKEVLDFHVALAKEAFDLGFDEVNFDYLRFPSDGKIENIAYQDNIEKEKVEVIKNAFIYLNQHLAYRQAGLKDKEKISIDLFGLTLWHLDDDSDMNIGQRLIDTLPYFDYVCPMVYPSHYPSGFLDLKNPAEYPYEVISANLKKMELVEPRRQGVGAPSSDASIGASEEENSDWATKIRPWLQAFNLGAEYNQDLLKKEIKAVEENGGYGFLFWNARNDYAVFKDFSAK